MAVQQSPPQSQMLPELRQELRLLEGPFGRAERCWLIHDPVRHRFYQISGMTFDVLERWSAQPAKASAERISVELGRQIVADDLNEIAKFLIVNNLTLEPAKGDALALASQQKASHHSLLKQAVHNYLYFRMPLVRPEQFLRRTLHWVEPLYSRITVFVFIATTLVGLYLTSRQWDLFVTTFLDFLTLEGALVYAATLLLVKSLHELGHAYTATRAGVRVNTMGIAFLVLTPILYTDVTDAWRLKSRREKLAIGAAGIVVELALAGISVFLWAFLADGPIRSAIFAIATTSLVMGLAVNLNPLMRFDGYYLLSDFWEIPNLQQRSNAMAQWWLRELLFAYGHEPPEVFSRGWRTALVIYALCVWVYRFFLFLGIALLVYNIAFKALGIILFAIEIGWFILLPVFREVRSWWTMAKHDGITRRGIVSGIAALLGLAAFVVPWQSSIAIQAVAMAGRETLIYAPRAARIETVSISEGQTISAGGVLLVLEAPDLDHELELTRKRIDLSRLRLERIAAGDADLANRIVLEREMRKNMASLQGLEVERGKLVIVSPHDGIARDVDRDLQQGEWIDASTALARIVEGSSTQAIGYISEDEVWRVSASTPVTFVPEDPLMPRIEGVLIEVVDTGARSIDWPYLASVHGGAVASDRNADNEVIPRAGQHLVRAKLMAPVPDHVVRGSLHLVAQSESMLSGAWRRVLRVLIRESGS